MRAPESKDITEHLNFICQSKSFRSSKRMTDFLKYVVLETVEGRGAELNQYAIAVNSLKRQSNFDPLLDPCVRISGARLRKKLQLFYYGEGSESNIRISIPSGTYIPKFSYAPKAPIKNVLINGQNPSYDNSLIVDNFINIGDKRDSYLTYGLSREIMICMSYFKHIKVYSTGLTEEHNKEDYNSFVRFKLEGHVHVQNNKIRFSLSLVDMKLNEHIWGQIYSVNQNIEEIIEIIGNIASDVSSEIVDLNTGVVFHQLLKETRLKSYENLDTYDNLLHFYEYEVNPTIENYDFVSKLTEETLKQYPNFAAGWGMLSCLYSDGSSLGFRENRISKALEYARKAVLMEPKNQMIRVHYAYSKMLNDELEDALKNARIALSLNPNSTYFIGSIGWIISLSGNTNEGLDLIQRAMSLNIAYPNWYHIATCLSYLGSNNFEDALKEAEKLEDYDMIWTPLLRFHCNVQLNNLKESRSLLREILKLSPDFIEKAKWVIPMLVKNSETRSQMLDNVYSELYKVS